MGGGEGGNWEPTGGNWEPGPPPRHRACNMFLEAYKLLWLVTEEHPFEDRMIDDLAVGVGLPHRAGGAQMGVWGHK